MMPEGQHTVALLTPAAAVYTSHYLAQASGCDMLIANQIQLYLS